MQATGVHRAAFSPQRKIFALSESRGIPVPALFLITTEEFGLLGFADEDVWMLRQNCGEGCCGRFCSANDDEIGERIMMLSHDFGMLAAKTLPDQFHGTRVGCHVKCVDQALSFLR